MYKMIFPQHWEVACIDFLVFSVRDKVKCGILSRIASSPETYGDVAGQFHSLPGTKDGADSLSTSMGLSSQLNLIWDKKKNKQVINLEFIFPCQHLEN